MPNTQRRCVSRCPLTLAAPALSLGPVLDQAAATPVPSQAFGATAARANAVAADRVLLQTRLVAFGLTESAAADRVALLTGEEVHAIVADPNSLQAAGGVDAGDAVWVAIAVVLLIWLVPHVNPDSW